MYIENKLNSEEIFDILKFYIELLNKINSRFDFKREVIKLLQIFTPSKVLSKEDVQYCPLF